MLNIPLFIFVLLSFFVFIHSYPFHQNRLVFVVCLEIVFASTRTIVFTTELNKSAAAPNEKSDFSRPDLYTNVEMTSEALRFVGFCRRNTFSYPTLSREPQFQISRIRMVGTRTGRLIYQIFCSLEAPSISAASISALSTPDRVAK